VLMSLWSFQGARGLECPLAETTAVTGTNSAGPTDLSKLNSVLAPHPTEVT